MIVELNGFVCHGNIGFKARSLVDLHRNGFKVPNSFALDTKEYFNAIKNIKNKINALLSRINFDNLEIISKQIKILFENVTLEDNIKDELLKILHDDEIYILRCSVDGVDESYSYAGLFPKKMGITKDNIFENIIDCYVSLFSYNSLYYMLKNNIDYSNIATAIIIQREIKTDILGYVTVVNPVTLNSNEVSILINKKNEYELFYYDKEKKKPIKEAAYNILEQNDIDATFNLAMEIQSNLGYPIEIELAYTKNHIYVIQTREVFSILYENMDDIWRKKNMSCKKFMYSLVSENYNKVISDYYNELRINDSREKILQVFNGCYYNAICIGNLLDSLFDYDNEFLMHSLGLETNIIRNNSFSNKIKRFFNRKYIDNKILFYLNNLEDFKNEHHNKYNYYCNEMSKVSANDIERKWSKLVIEDYNKLYKKYLDLKLLVLFEKNRLYKKLKPYITIREFEELIIVKEKTSRYKISKIYNNLINNIKKDEETYKYWFSSSTLKILKDYNEKKMTIVIKILSILLIIMDIYLILNSIYPNHFM